MVGAGRIWTTFVLKVHIWAPPKNIMHSALTSDHIFIAETRICRCTHPSQSAQTCLSRSDMPPHLRQPPLPCTALRIPWIFLWISYQNATQVVGGGTRWYKVVRAGRRWYTLVRSGRIWTILYPKCTFWYQKVA